MTRSQFLFVRNTTGSLGLLAFLVAGCNSTNSKSSAAPDAASDDASADTVTRSDLSHDNNPNVSDADYRAFINATNQFGFDLLQKLAPSEPGNMVYSTTSAVHALAMTYLGAKKNTQTQMAAVLHDTFTSGIFHTAINRLTIDLASRNIAPQPTAYGDLSVTLNLVDDIWAQAGFTLESTYLNDLATYYNSGVHIEDFIHNADGSRTTINQWVADHTANRIQNLLPPGSIDGTTRLVLSNALYFKGSWAQPFDVQSTSNATFNHIDATTVQVPMMHGERNCNYTEGTNYQMVDVPFYGGNVSMTLLLPAVGHFADIRDQLNQSWWSQVTAAMANATVDITLPKFSFTWGSKSLATALKSLGMTDAFDATVADFSGIEPTRQLHIDDVLQKAFIAADESGVEAAAATAVTMSGNAAPSNIKIFTADQPFLCFIRDASGEILFAGQVLDPSAS